jgi:hypothetical protein
MANFALSLEIVRAARHQARKDEWLAAGNTGPMPPEPRKPLEPPPPATARRYDREMWRKIATIRARELDLNLSIGRISDDDLHRAITDAAPDHG